jgi:hypothetical protein
MDSTLFFEALFVALPVFMIVRTMILRGKKLLD